MLQLRLLFPLESMKTSAVNKMKFFLNNVSTPIVI